jgi:hypothetical protein
MIGDGATDLEVRKFNETSKLWSKSDAAVLSPYSAHKLQENCAVLNLPLLTINSELID